MTQSELAKTPLWRPLLSTQQNAPKRFFLSHTGKTKALYPEILSKSELLVPDSGQTTPPTEIAALSLRSQLSISDQLNSWKEKLPSVILTDFFADEINSLVDSSKLALLIERGLCICAPPNIPSGKASPPNSILWALDPKLEPRATHEIRFLLETLSAATTSTTLSIIEWQENTSLETLPINEFDMVIAVSNRMECVLELGTIAHDCNARFGFWTDAPISCLREWLLEWERIPFPLPPRELRPFFKFLHSLTAKRQDKGNRSDINGSALSVRSFLGGPLRRIVNDRIQNRKPPPLAEALALAALCSEPERTHQTNPSSSTICSVLLSGDRALSPAIFQAAACDNNLQIDGKIELSPLPQKAEQQILEAILAARKLQQKSAESNLVNLIAQLESTASLIPTQLGRAIINEDVSLLSDLSALADHATPEVTVATFIARSSLIPTPIIASDEWKRRLCCSSALSKGDWKSALGLPLCTEDILWSIENAIWPLKDFSDFYFAKPTPVREASLALLRERAKTDQRLESRYLAMQACSPADETDGFVTLAKNANLQFTDVLTIVIHLTLSGRRDEAKSLWNHMRDSHLRPNNDPPRIMDLWYGEPTRFVEQYMQWSYSIGFMDETALPGHGTLLDHWLLSVSLGLTSMEAQLKSLLPRMGFQFLGMLKAESNIPERFLETHLRKKIASAFQPFAPEPK